MSSGYELHQKLRTKTVRQVKKKQYDEAITTLYQGALDLLQQGEQGSGCDLALYMINVYGLKPQDVDAESRDRITDILQATAPDFWRKKVVDAAVKWSVKSVNASTGDPLLRLFVAKLLAKDGDFHAAEQHFLAACVPAPSTYTVESAPLRFAEMMIQWLQSHAQEAAQVTGETRDANTLERIEAGRFALRAVCPLLANHAIAQANAFLKAYLNTLMTKHKSLLLPVQPNPRPFSPPGKNGAPSTLGTQLYVLASFELNWLQNVLALVNEAEAVTGGPDAATRKRCPDAYKQAWSSCIGLYQREAPQQEECVLQTVPLIGQAVFDIQPPRAQSNMLSDMMASMFGGGPGASAGPAAPQAQIKSAPPPSKSAPAPAAQPAATQADDLVDDEMD